MRELRYVDLARQAKETGNHRIYWLAIKNQARVMRKLNEQQKTAIRLAVK